MPDKELTCLDCGNGFLFTEQEQQEFARKGYRNEPKRCPDCRRQKRDGPPRGFPTARDMHAITCSQCGKQSQVPFKPRQDRPVYCDECFRATKR